ncbi:hypothetical protein DLJ53_31090 [Acuticoccus sediminis]|uniref:Uncharacterized protein n=1 Tax=Acuticoccus sediminis TaxID=2184697 RepID=A0A8B2NPI6_9HYPH|nr:hypothetical protein DLJ53_31090 [Acuticoccus sediminis]
MTPGATSRSPRISTSPETWPRRSFSVNIGVERDHDCSAGGVCPAARAWGTTIELITTPERTAYHDRTDLRRWQDEG